MTSIADYYPSLVELLLNTDESRPAKLFIVGDPTSQGPDDDQDCDGENDDVVDYAKFFPKYFEVDSVGEDDWLRMGSDPVDQQVPLSDTRRSCWVIPIMNVVYALPEGQQIREGAFWKPLEKIISSLPRGGKILMPVPFRFLCAPDEKDKRKQFFGNRRSVIIEHDHTLSANQFRMGGIHDRNRMATICLWAEEGPKTFFRIQTADLKDYNGVEEELRALLAEGKKSVKRGFTYDKPLFDCYPIQFEYYSPAAVGARDKARKSGENAVLSSVADILRGEKRETCPTALGVSCMDESCITADLVVDLSRAKKVSKANSDDDLQAGDLCLSFTATAGGMLKFAEFPKGNSRTTFDSSVFVIRFKNTIDELERNFIQAYLRSPLALAGLFPNGALRAQEIDLEHLGQWEVPKFEGNYRQAYEQVSKAKEKFQDWMAEADAALNSIMIEDNARVLRTRIFEEGNNSLLRFQAGSQVHIPDHRILNNYPRPLSFVWAEYKASIREEHDSYYEVMAKIKKAGETLISFTALVAASCCHACGYDAFTGNRLSMNKKGFDFGTWYTILQNAIGPQANNAANNSHLMPELFSLKADENFNEAVKSIKELRDEDAHLRIPQTDLEKRVDAAKAHLEVLFESVRFLSAYSFRVVDQTRCDTLREIRKITYRELHGCALYSTSRRVQLESCTDIEEGSLYLVNKRGKERWHLLRPFLLLEKCPSHKLESFFHLDSWNRNSPSWVTLRSFEFSSPLVKNMTEVFIKVKLLEPIP